MINLSARLRFIAWIGAKTAASRAWPATAMAAVALFATTVGAQSLRGPQPLDNFPESDLNPPIEWEEDWGTTLRNNHRRWTAQVNEETSHGGERNRRIQLRTARLLEAMVEHFKQETQRHLPARLDIARRLAEAGRHDLGLYHLKGMIDAQPGHLDLAAAAMQMMVDILGGSPQNMPERDAWADYVQARVLALVEGGYWSANHQTVLQAYEALADIRRQQGRWLALEQILRRAEPWVGRSGWWQARRILALRDTGHSDQGRQAFDQLLSTLHPDDPHARTIRGWLRDQVRRFRPNPPPPTILTDMAAEQRWSAMREQAVVDAMVWAALVEVDPQGANLVAWDTQRYTSAWAAANRQVQAQGEAGRQALRRTHETEAAAAVGRASPGDPDAVMALFRYWPWSASVHRLMVDHGETLLWSGDAGAAARVFRDVLAHAAPDDALLKEQAQVGLWLATAQQGDAAGLAAAFEGVNLRRNYPWMGQSRQGSVIREQLEATLATATPNVAGPSRRGEAVGWLNPPPGAASPLAFLTEGLPEWGRALPAPRPMLVSGQGLVVLAGPNIIAGFDADSRQLRWWRRLPVSVLPQDGVVQDWVAALPGVFTPAIAHGRVFTRWGVDDAGLVPANLAAFDADSGMVVWTTADDRAWRLLRPISDPVIAGRSLFVLALDDGVLAGVHLVCLDPQTGRTRWRRTLGSQQSRIGTSRSDAIDPVSYGNAVTVHDGSVYCSTNLGIVARVDARDGVIDWVQTYTRASVDGMRALLGRDGAPPQVVGETVIFAPRDVHGLLAFDAHTGQRNWSLPLMPSDQVLGAVGSSVIVQDAHTLAAVQAEDGTVVWSRNWSSRPLARSILVDGSILVATDEGLARFSATSGARQSVTAFNSATPAALAVHDEHLIGLSLTPPVDAAAAGVDALQFGKPSPGQQLQLPLALLARIERPNARLILPPDDAPAGNLILLHSVGGLEALDLADPTTPRWSLPLAGGLDRVVWARRQVVLISGAQAQGVDLGNGAVRWRHRMAGTISHAELAGQVLCLAALQESEAHDDVALIEIDAGRVRWHRSFAVVLPHWVGDMTWDGQVVRLLGHTGGPHPTRRQIMIDPAQGRLVDARDFMHRDYGRLHDLVLLGKWVYAIRHNFELIRVDLTAPEARIERLGRIEGFRVERYARRLAVHDPWVRLHFRQRWGDTPREVDWVIHRDHPDVILRDTDSTIMLGSRIYRLKDDQLEAMDWPANQPTTRFDLPELEDAGKADLLAVWEDGDRLVVLSRRQHRQFGVTMNRLWVDLFQRQDGKHLQGAPLPYQGWRRGNHFRQHDSAYISMHTPVYLHRGLLLICENHTLSIYGHARDGGGWMQAVREIAPVAADTIQIDADLTDWLHGPSLPFVASDGQQGTLRLAYVDAPLLHDARLLLAVEHPQGRAAPWLGEGARTVGSRLELGVEFQNWQRYTLGLDETGRLRTVVAGRDNLPEGFQAAVRLDPQSRMLRYEVAIPLRDITTRREGQWLDSALSVTAWRDDNGTLHPVRYRFGLGLDVSDRPDSVRHELLRFIPPEAEASDN